MVGENEEGLETYPIFPLLESENYGVSFLFSGNPIELIGGKFAR
jgi:hypothetical protein